MTPAAIAGAPFGTDGPAHGGKCRCGAAPHPQLQGRCAAGHTLRGNSFAVVTGATSVQFWAQHAEAQRDIAAAVIRDAGHSVDDAPQALRVAADSIAQATLIRDAAYMRMVETGGPLATSGHVRRAFTVWATAADRVERLLRLVGLRRSSRPAASFADAVRGGAR